MNKKEVIDAIKIITIVVIVSGVILFSYACIFVYSPIYNPESLITRFIERCIGWLMAPLGSGF